jgi:hypothetical protein
VGQLLEGELEVVVVVWWEVVVVVESVNCSPRIKDENGGIGREEGERERDEQQLLPLFQLQLV